MRVDVDPCDGVRKPGTVGLPLPGPDVRVVDTEGNSVPCGERGEVVIRGGENIYPKEIETALYGHDGVLEAAVVGRPGRRARRGRHRLCRAAPGRRLATYKRPVLIEVLDELPKNPVGKLDKPACELASASHAVRGRARPASPIVGVN